MRQKSDCNLTDNYYHCRDCERAERTIKMLESKIKVLMEMLEKFQMCQQVTIITSKTELNGGGDE